MFILRDGGFFLLSDCNNLRRFFFCVCMFRIIIVIKVFILVVWFCGCVVNWEWCMNNLIWSSWYGISSCRRCRVSFDMNGCVLIRILGVCECWLFN